MSKVLKAIHAYEQLGEIENEPNVFKKQELLKKYGNTAPLAWLLSLNFRKDIILDLPEGMPEIELKHLDALTHPDFMGLLASGIARVAYCKNTSQLPRAKKESIFYDTLINCPLKDAEILCSAKDKALEELYPSITKELVKSVFPRYVTE